MRRMWKRDCASFPNREHIHTRIYIYILVLVMEILDSYDPTITFITFDRENENSSRNG